MHELSRGGFFLGDMQGCPENLKRTIAINGKQFLLIPMSAVEAIVEELKTLSPEDLEKTENYIHDLKKERLRLRQDMLKMTYGALAGEKGECFEKAIEDCECTDVSSW